MPDSYDLILNELGYIRKEVDRISIRLDKQNGRIDKTEQDVLLLRHDADIEHEMKVLSLADARQDKLIKFLEKYAPSLSLGGGLFYVIAKMNGWVQ